MVLPAPNKKTVDIISDIHEILRTGLYDDFTLKRCKLEAKKLKKQDVFLEEVFIILGMIACIEGDINKMHSYYRSALGYSGENYLSLSNYAASLMCSSLHKEAYEYALKAFELEKREKNIHVILFAAYLINNKNELNKYAQIYKKLYRKDHFMFSEPKITLRNIAVHWSHEAQCSIVYDIIKKCTSYMVKCFGLPLIIELELMRPIDGVGEQWIAWIMSNDNIENGLDKIDMLHDWCIENQIDKGVENFNFNIDFLGAQ